MDAVEVLPSGRVVALTMPDLYGILATVGRVPSQLMIDVLNLLIADGAWTPEEAGENKYLRKREAIRGYYAIAALCLVTPTLDLTLKPADPRPEGVIGPTDLSWRDVEVIYHGWFRGWALPPPAPPAGDPDAHGAPGAAPDGGDLRPAPKPARGRTRSAGGVADRPAVPLGGPAPETGNAEE